MASSITTQKKLFKVPEDQFSWKALPLYIRDYYNYMMGVVYQKEEANIKADPKTRFYDTQLCLALNGFSNNPKEYGGNTYCDELKEAGNLNNGPCYPQFKYLRKLFSIKDVDTSLELGSKLNMGAVIWL